MDSTRYSPPRTSIRDNGTNASRASRVFAVETLKTNQRSAAAECLRKFPLEKVDIHPVSGAVLYVGEIPPQVKLELGRLLPSSLWSVDNLGDDSSLSSGGKKKTHHHISLASLEKTPDSQPFIEAFRGLLQPLLTWSPGGAYVYVVTRTW